jgi:hypothetical protein
MSGWCKACCVLLLAGPLVSLGGCYKATFVNPSVPPGPQIEEWTDFFLLGLIGHEEIDVRRLCPGEVATIRTGGNVATDVITGLTLGVYAPRKIYVSCAGITVPSGPPTLPPAGAPPALLPTIAPPFAPAPAAPPSTPGAALEPNAPPLSIRPMRVAKASEILR